MNLLTDFNDYFDKKSATREQVIKAIRDTYELIHDETINPQDVYYTIADLMFLKVVSSDDTLEALCLIAGELELPDEHISDKEKLEKQFMELYSEIISSL